MPRQANPLILAAFLTLALTAPAIAAEAPSEAGAYLKQEIARKVPQNWQVHVSRRGDGLIAFFMPPYQVAFDLWYEPNQLREKILALCPSNDDAIWRMLAPRKKYHVPTDRGRQVHRGDAADVSPQSDAASLSARHSAAATGAELRR